MNINDNIRAPQENAISSLNGETDKPFSNGARSVFNAARKASNEQIIEAYNRLHNVWKVAEELGMCGQSVQQRLKRLGIPRNNPQLSEIEIAKIKAVYTEGITCGDGKLRKLSKEIKRTVPFIARQAGKLGLTYSHRAKSKKLRDKMSIRAKKYIKLHGHPRGFLDHTHNPDARERISNAMTLSWMKMTRKESHERTQKIRMSNIQNGNGWSREGDQKKTWKAQWAKVGPHFHYFRSSWEVTYALYLEEKRYNGEIEYWEPESCTFWFNKINERVKTYTPDFCVYENDGTETFHEVKGWMDERSISSLKLMKICFPSITVVLIDKQRYHQLFGKVARKLYSEKPRTEIVISTLI